VSQGWSKGQWAVYLSALLKGKALEVYCRLPVKDAQVLKDALLPKRLAAMSHDQRNDGRGFRKEFQQSGQNSSYRDERAGTDSNETCVKTVHEEMMMCVVHDRENCQERNRTAKKCRAMLASEWTLECECKLPVVADACQVHNERMSICIGMMGGQSVSVLRDTGCSTVVAKRELVDDEKMTGGTETCILIDGVPSIKIQVSVPPVIF